MIHELIQSNCHKALSVDGPGSADAIAAAKRKMKFLAKTCKEVLRQVRRRRKAMFLRRQLWKHKRRKMKSKNLDEDQRKTQNAKRKRQKLFFIIGGPASLFVYFLVFLSFNTSRLRMSGAKGRLTGLNNKIQNVSCLP